MGGVGHTPPTPRTVAAIWTPTNFLQQVVHHRTVAE